MLYEPVARIIIFYSTSSINLVINLHKFNIQFIHRNWKFYPTKKKLKNQDSLYIIKTFLYIVGTLFFNYFIF